MEAVAIGTSPAGVEWVCYPKTGETETSFWQRRVAMRKRLRIVTERHAHKTQGIVRVRLTQAQMALVLDEMDRTETYSEHRIGRTYIDLTPAQAEHLAEGIESTRMEPGEIEAQILCGSFKDLTDAQVTFGTAQALKSAKATVKALRKA